MAVGSPFAGLLLSELSADPGESDMRLAASSFTASTPFPGEDSEADCASAWFAVSTLLVSTEWSGDAESAIDASNDAVYRANCVQRWGRSNQRVR